MPLEVMDLTTLSTSKQLPTYLRSKPPPPFKLPESSPWALPPSSSTFCHPHGVIPRQTLLGNDQNSKCRQNRNQRHPVPEHEIGLNVTGRGNQRIGMKSVRLVATGQASILQTHYTDEKKEHFQKSLSLGTIESKSEFLRPHEQKQLSIHDYTFEQSLFAPEPPVSHLDVPMSAFSNISGKIVALTPGVQTPAVTAPVLESDDSEITAEEKFDSEQQQ